MTIDEATPLIGAVVQVLAQLVTRIVDSAHMTEDQKKIALQRVMDELDATAAKVGALKF